MKAWLVRDEDGPYCIDLIEPCWDSEAVLDDGLSGIWMSHGPDESTLRFDECPPGFPALSKGAKGIAQIKISAEIVG